MKTHPLTKLQFLLAALWVTPLFMLLMSVRESEQSILLLISMFPFVGLSLVTIYLGWLMAVKKDEVIYPFQSLGFRLTKKLRGEQAAKNLVLKYSKPGWKLSLGIMNIFSGSLCFISAIIGIVIILRAL